MGNLAGIKNEPTGFKAQYLQGSELTTKFPSRYRVLSCICLSWVSDSPPEVIVGFRVFIVVT